MFIAWTTMPSRAAAQALAGEVVRLGLAACAQIEGPIESYYRWENKPERAEEFRVMFKCMPDRIVALETHVTRHHPYETPEWIAVRADRISEKYLSWAGSNITNLPP
ncbi:MAG: ion tolerance protein CutA [Verrucomicrobia bacterium]|nr:ion tolerance protein CutA [Verrucomicrobiota bacterium]